jgi:hypothetical protein
MVLRRIFQSGCKKGEKNLFQLTSPGGYRQVQTPNHLASHLDSHFDSSSRPVFRPTHYGQNYASFRSAENRVLNAGAKTQRALLFIETGRWLRPFVLTAFGL